MEPIAFVASVKYIHDCIRPARTTCTQVLFLYYQHVKTTISTQNFRQNVYTVCCTYDSTAGDTKHSFLTSEGHFCPQMFCKGLNLPWAWKGIVEDILLTIVLEEDPSNCVRYNCTPNSTQINQHLCEFIWNGIRYQYKLWPSTNSTVIFSSSLKGSIHRSYYSSLSVDDQDWKLQGDYDIF